MSELVFSDAANDAYVSHDIRFHGFVACPFNECRHNRWEPRAWYERSGDFVCALTVLPNVGDVYPGINQDSDYPFTRVYQCLDYEPTKQHKRFKPTSSKRSGYVKNRRYSGDGSYSGASGIDELGMCYADFDIPVWGSD